MELRTRKMKPCPCGHLHPAGAGVNMCFCTDCWLLFGDTPRMSLSPSALDRLKEIEND